MGAEAKEGGAVGEFEPFEREVLLRAFAKRGWIDLFDLHQAYQLSPGQLSHAARRFHSGGIAELEGLLFRLTPQGRRWVFQNRRAIFMAAGRRYWAEVPGVASQEKVSPLAPYLPPLKKVRLASLAKSLRPQ